MSTNFYLIPNELYNFNEGEFFVKYNLGYVPLDKFKGIIKRAISDMIDEEYHIGKYVSGWKFRFQITRNWKNYKEILNAIMDKDFVLVDEYGLVWETDKFIKLIEDSYENEENKIPGINGIEKTNSDYIDNGGYWFIRSVFF